MKSFALAVAAAATLTAVSAQAETELSFYLGAQSAPHSRITGTDPGNSVSEELDFLAAWEGKSFTPPPYYGYKITFWNQSGFGWGLDYNHAKVYADDATREDNGFSRLEFTDGLNLITVNAYKRWDNMWGDFTPYVGAGLGVAVPHVDIESEGGKTLGYQVTGPAAVLIAGSKYDLGDRWALFGEYKFSYTQNDADLGSGGSIKTNVLTNALNFGLSFKF